MIVEERPVSLNIDSNTCLLKFFGDYRPVPRHVPPETEADLYSAFVSKAASLGWASTYSNDASPTLWGMEDAYLQDKRVDNGLAAWIRVGLVDSVQPLPKSGGPLLPIALCTNEAISDFGDIELDAAQFEFPIDAISSESVGLDSLETWLYPAPPDSRRTLALTISINTSSPTTFGTAEAESLLQSPLLSGMLSHISHPDLTPGSNETSEPTGVDERSSSLPLLRATADAPRWGAVQSACIATALAYVLSEAGASGSISVRIEALPSESDSPCSTPH